MLKQSSLNLLRGKRNLLAFSGGIDSTTLFFLLQNENITFDIAIVNYNTREQSKEEVAYAQELAKKYSLQCYVFNAEKLTSNFEANAREIRYNFFRELITQHSYDSLLTAHHLGDRFEWMMMQFCKGAGCVELAGMKESEIRDNHTLIRPLLHLDKPELLNYLHTHNITYFEDETNADEAILRNSFRHKYTQPLLNTYLDGIKKSFLYLDEDREILAPETKIESIEGLSYFRHSINPRSDSIVIDKYLKQHGHIITANERKLLKEETSIILGRKYLVSKIGSFIFITPFKDLNISMNKEFKEACRVLKIEPKLRPYLCENENVFIELTELLLSS